MSHRRHKSLKCRNCGYAWPAPPDEFCPLCGQENTGLDIPVSHWILEFIEVIFHVDGKIGVTLRYLLLKPGKMSAEFVAGRRAKFIPPARLYIFVSFIFFLALSTLHYQDAMRSVATPSEAELGQRWDEVSINMLGENTIAFDGGGITRGEVRKAYLAGAAALDSLFASRGLELDSSAERGFYHQAAKIETFGPEVFQEKMMKLFSLGAFLLMPAYAGLLALFFRRVKWFTSHIVLSVHAHVFLFLSITLSIGAAHLDADWLLYFIVACAGVVHFLSLRRFYGNPWAGVAWRFVALTVLYLALLLFFLVCALTLTFILV